MVHLQSFIFWAVVNIQPPILWGIKEILFSLALHFLGGLQTSHKSTSLSDEVAKESDERRPKPT